MASSTETRAQPSDELSLLCGEVAALFRRRWGRGPVRTFAQWAGRNALIVLMDNGHTDAEKTLRAAGHIQAERALGRKVVTTLSATRLDPDISAEIFLLEPDGAVAEPDESIVARAARAQLRADELSDEARALAAQRDQIQRRREQHRSADG